MIKKSWFSFILSKRQWLTISPNDAPRFNWLWTSTQLFGVKPLRSILVWVSFGAGAGALPSATDLSLIELTSDFGCSIIAGLWSSANSTFGMTFCCACGTEFTSAWGFFRLLSASVSALVTALVTADFLAPGALPGRKANALSSTISKPDFKSGARSKSFLPRRQTW